MTCNASHLVDQHRPLMWHFTVLYANDGVPEASSQRACSLTRILRVQRDVIVFALESNPMDRRNDGSRAGSKDFEDAARSDGGKHLGHCDACLKDIKGAPFAAKLQNRVPRDAW